MIYKNVERIRQAKGVTKTHVAKKAGISLQRYIHITNGSTRLDAETLKRIAEVLEEDPAVFFNNKLTESVIKRLERTPA